MLRQYYGENIATSIVAHDGRGVHRLEDIFWASSLGHLFLSPKMEVDMKIVMKGVMKVVMNVDMKGGMKVIHHAYGRRGASFFRHRV